MIVCKREVLGTNKSRDVIACLAAGAYGRPEEAD